LVERVREALDNSAFGRERVREALDTVLGFDDPSQYVKKADPNAPPPPPELLTAQASQTAAQARIMDAQTRMVESKIKLASAQQDAQLKTHLLETKERARWRTHTLEEAARAGRYCADCHAI